MKMKTLRGGEGERGGKSLGNHRDQNVLKRKSPSSKKCKKREPPAKALNTRHSKPNETEAESAGFDPARKFLRLTSKSYRRR